MYFWEHVPLFFCLFFFFLPCWNMWDLSPQIRGWIVSPTLEARSLTHWIAREVPPIALVVTTSLVPHEGSWISLRRKKKKKKYIYIYMVRVLCRGWLSGFCQAERWCPVSVDRNQSSWGGGCLHQQNLKVRRMGVSLLAMEKTGSLETLPLNYLHSH